jgi:hypothetical protein
MTPHGKQQQLALWKRAWLRVALDRGMRPKGAAVPPCTEEERTLLTQLWDLVGADIEKEARHPRYNWISNVVIDRAVCLFSYAAFELLAGQVQLGDPPQLPALLRRVARCRATDEYRSLFGRRTSPDPAHVEPGSHAASMVPVTPPHLPLEQLFDTASLDHEDDLIAAIDATTLVCLIWELWSSLPWPDDVIMRLRWSADPPRPFLSIAQHLGVGWTEDAVRKRHQRVMDHTRDELRKRGLSNR